MNLETVYAVSGHCVDYNIQHTVLFIPKAFKTLQEAQAYVEGRVTSEKEHYGSQEDYVLNVKHDPVSSASNRIFIQGISKNRFFEIWLEENYI